MQFQPRATGSGLVTIATFRDLPNALLAQGRLSADGIETVLLDENIVRMDWLVANAVGGVKLQVHADDAEEAIELLEAPMPARIPVTHSGEVYEQPVCPACESMNLTCGDASKPMTFLSWLLVGIPLPLRHKLVWRCGGCGYEWPELSEKEYLGE